MPPWAVKGRRGGAVGPPRGRRGPPRDRRRAAEVSPDGDIWDASIHASTYISATVPVGHEGMLECKVWEGGGFGRECMFSRNPPKPDPKLYGASRSPPALFFIAFCDGVSRQFGWHRDPFLAGPWGAPGRLSVFFDASWGLLGPLLASSAPPWGVLRDPLGVGLGLFRRPVC